MKISFDSSTPSTLNVDIFFDDEISLNTYPSIGKNLWCGFFFKYFIYFINKCNISLFW